MLYRLLSIALAIGKKLQEFKNFCVYIDEARKSARLEKMPEIAEELLSLMKQN